LVDLLLKALSQVGVTEIVGESDNPRILDYFEKSGHSWVKNDELAWCSAFINWVAKLTGYEYTKRLNARSWLDVGEEIQDPHIGDLVIFWRKSKSSVYGHVGLFISQEGQYIHVLGGNQSNRVRISKYSKSQLLGYRRLKKTA